MPLPPQAVQYTTADGSLYGAVNGDNENFYFTPSPSNTAAESLLFRNGVLMTQTEDGATAGNAASLSAAQVPQIGDVVTVRAWLPDVVNNPSFPLNAPAQFTSADGSILGLLNGVNNTFILSTPTLVTEIQVFWNGLFMTYGKDYIWRCSEISSAGVWQSTITMINGQIPNFGDTLTAEAYSL